MNDSDLGPLSGLANIFQFDRVFLLALSGILLVLLVKGIKRFANSLYLKFPSRRLAISQVVTSLNFFIYIVGGTVLVYFHPTASATNTIWILTCNQIA
ncbi:MAG: hypothetical protein Q8M09_20565 [Pseudomonadota bacterium]|nr:hypothetical protein [Pseudomonadota bacterium]MDP2353679.1 hypothetical protein [Pseudomonadota bacterium]